MTVKIGSWEIGRYPGETNQHVEESIAWAIYVLKAVKIAKDVPVLKRDGRDWVKDDVIALLEALRHDTTVRPEARLARAKRQGYWVSTVLSSWIFNDVNSALADLNHSTRSALFEARVVLSSAAGILEWSTATSQSDQANAVDGFRSVFAMFDLDWQMRERLRFHGGYYEPLPWTSVTPIDGHFAHLSVRELGMIAFTPDDAKGAADVQVRMKPGRYITKFYPGLDTKEVQRLAAMVSSTVANLRFAAEPGHIERVYRNGPGSCMSHDKTHFKVRVNGEHVHPVTVYGNSDIQIAYLGNEDGTQVSARCVVWPAQKLYGRCYGDEYKLQTLLNMAGFKSGSMKGAKIRKIKADGHGVFLMPYVDNVAYVRSLDDKWWEIDGGGDVFVQDQRGWCSIYGNDPETEDDEPEYDYHCDSCGDGCNDTWEVYTRHGSQHWCEGCRDNNTFRCERSEMDHLDSDFNTVEVNVMQWRRIVVAHPNGSSTTESYPLHVYPTQTWADDTADDHAFQCDRNGNWYCSETVRLYVMENGETWSQEAFDDDGIEIGGKFYPKDDQPELPLAVEAEVTVPASA